MDHIHYSSFIIQYFFKLFLDANFMSTRNKKVILTNILSKIILDRTNKSFVEMGKRRKAIISHYDRGDVKSFGYHMFWPHILQRGVNIMSRSKIM